jgi:hypothetical protein
LEGSFGSSFLISCGCCGFGSLSGGASGIDSCVCGISCGVAGCCCGFEGIHLGLECGAGCDSFGLSGFYGK